MFLLVNAPNLLTIFLAGGGFLLRCGLWYFISLFLLCFNFAAFYITGSGQSWQLSHYLSEEIFWGPINSQRLQLANGIPGDKWVWPAAQAVKAGSCSLVKTYLLCSDAVLLCRWFLYLCEWMALGSGELVLCLARQKLRDTGAAEGLVSDSQDFLLTHCSSFCLWGLWFSPFGGEVWTQTPLSSFWNAVSSSGTRHVHVLPGSRALGGSAGPSLSSHLTFLSQPPSWSLPGAPIVKLKSKDVSGGLLSPYCPSSFASRKLCLFFKLSNDYVVLVETVQNVFGRDTLAVFKLGFA